MTMRRSAGRRKRSERKKKTSGGQNWREREGSKVFVVAASVLYDCPRALDDKMNWNHD